MTTSTSEHVRRTRGERLEQVERAYRRIHRVPGCLEVDPCLVSAWAITHYLFPVPNWTSPPDLCLAWERRLASVLEASGVRI